MFCKKSTILAFKLIKEIDRIFEKTMVYKWLRCGGKHKTFQKTLQQTGLLLFSINFDIFKGPCSVLGTGPTKPSSRLAIGKQGCV